MSSLPIFSEPEKQVQGKISVYSIRVFFWSLLGSFNPERWCSNTISLGFSLFLFFEYLRCCSLNSSTVVGLMGYLYCYAFSSAPSAILGLQVLQANNNHCEQKAPLGVSYSGMISQTASPLRCEGLTLTFNWVESSKSLI